ncbi:MAG TPA: DsbA family protein [Caulobacteraceae bacterium]
MRLLQAVAALAVLTLVACGEPKADEAFGKKVRAYLLEHPEVLQEAYERLQVKQQEQALLAASKAIEANKKALENDPRDFVANPSGKITVVEFFDYNCGYCKLIAPEVLALARANPDVRFVFKDMTIFGEASEYAAAGAHLTKTGGKYLDVHRAFMAEKPLEDDDVARILTLHGVSPAAARQRQQSAEQRKYLEDQHQLAAALGIQGTPAFVVGDVMIPGADPLALKQAIAAVKQGKSPRIEVHGGASRPAA